MTPEQACLLWAVLATLAAVHLASKLHEQTESRCGCEREREKLRRELRDTREAFERALDRES